jgi:hypothetical protein
MDLTIGALEFGVDCFWIDESGDVIIGLGFVDVGWIGESEVFSFGLLF